ncbi:imidazole glycerol phosphate synthase subunit HisF [Silvanigrella sp.]|jgi:cyclase|uniref:imidazole glycerol phosphate synthase subunit HisF n=1 Tax=Silvanigrella sp. TaxID=2024976 RepID=UPI0037CBA9DD
MNHRIIARLDVKGPNLVKGIHLEGLRVLGDPVHFAEYYYEQGADEIIYMDVVASLYERNSLHDLISKTAKKTFIPITVGGGIRSIEDIKSILRCGADKVAINTAAIKDPNLIKEASKKFGSSTIVVALEVIKQPNGDYLVFTDNGREYTGIHALAWAKQVEEFGAGEIIITSVDNEGTGGGYDNNIISILSKSLSIPVIAHGGAGCKQHIYDCFFEGKADAIAIASLIHYESASKLFSKYTTTSEGNIEYLKSNAIPQFITPASIPIIKEFLLNKSIQCRPYKGENQ